jgi:Na+/H+ antiporter NhaD/arsenite permease-like protein|tara:strand:- start:599 stop:880 length:282 start_codon:yes stop_codon:yes gene_type:complete
MQALIIFMSFLDFMFYPTVVATIVAVIIEQIVRRISNPEWDADLKLINRTMGIRKFFYRQAVIVNILWFLGYFVIMVTMGRHSPQTPDMIWQG